MSGGIAQSVRNKKHRIPVEMNIRSIKLVGLSFLMLITSAISSCHQVTDQERVKKLITEVQKGVEEKDVRKVLDRISKSYLDPQGNNYEGIKGMLIAYFYQYPKISLYIINLEVAPEDAGMRARFDAVLTGRSSGSTNVILPESIDIYSFDVHCIKESSEWKIKSATWKKTAEPDHR